MNFNLAKKEVNVENREVSEKTEEIFSITDKISMLLKDNNLEGWVIGGLAADAYAGKIMREHSDADFVVWQKDREKIAEILQKNFNIEKGRRNKNGEFVATPHKIVAKRGQSDADIAFLEYDEETNEFFCSLMPELRFPQKFLAKKEVSLTLSDGSKSTYTVPSAELLLALKIKSERTLDKKDVDLLIKQIDDPNKVEEIREKYAFDYNKFREIAWEEK
jgi:hypothetical protein